MRDLLESTLKRLVKDAGRKQVELKDASTAALERLEAVSDDALEAEDSPADAYLKPLLMALSSPQPKTIVASLDCFQKLMSYGFLQGQTKASDAGLQFEDPEATVMDVVVRSICACEDTDGRGGVADDSVQLQVIKALLTAVTSAGCGVHETSLLNSVRACYHIHLYSRNPVNKTTAKATLTQMMSAIFQQMEVADAKISHKEETQQESTNADNEPNTSSTAEDEDEAADDQDDDDDQHDNLQKSTAASEETSAPGESEAAAAKEAEKKVAESLETKGAEEAVQKCVHDFDECMYPGVSSQLGLEDMVVYTPRSPRDLMPTAAATTEDEGPVPVSVLEEAKEEQKKPKQKKKQATKSVTPFKSIQHKDAYLLFRALCKLSMKNQSLIDGSGEDYTPDPIALRSKILSLDLVLNILESSGPAFRNNKDFVYAIKTYLTSSLVKNSVSSNTQVVGLSLRIFVALQARFSEHLKEEIELVISKIFLPLLESSNSPHEHKVLVLEVFAQIAKDVETLVSIFLNYDCDWDSIDLYSRIVKVLSKLASGTRPSGATGTLSQEDQQKVALHEMSLVSIVSILESLAEFTHVQENLPGNRRMSVVENSHDENGDGPYTTDVEPVTPMSPPTVDLNNTGEYDDDTNTGNEMGLSAMSRQGSIGGPGRGSVGEDSAPLLSNLLGNQDMRRLKVDSFQQKQKYRRDIESAASKFLIKPKRGIEFLIKEGYIDRTPEDVATALLQFQDVFSKTKIGEYLGEDDDFNVQTLYCYVDELDFTDTVIDNALRSFLAGFRLPGEAQKIDRIIEKFAARYFETNPESFPSADTAYVLAFAIIMLHTDLHNPNIPVEKKMTGQGFIAMNGGIAGGRDLDPDFLLGIYERIKTQEISLKEDDGDRERERQRSKGGLAAAASMGFFGNSREAVSRRRRAAFSKERQEMLESATLLLPASRGQQNQQSQTTNAKPVQHTPTGRQPLMRVRSAGAIQAGLNHGIGATATTPAGEASEAASETSSLHAAQANGHSMSAKGDPEHDSEDGNEAYFYDSNDHVRPMFAVTWAPFCAVFSVNMQNTSEFVIVYALINGMKAALRIACRFNMADERRTLFDALTKFTLLNSTQEMKAKHIECVRALVEVVQLEGNYLSSSWEPALTCFSQLSRLQLIYAGATDDLISDNKTNTTSPGNRRRLSLRRSQTPGPSGNHSAHNTHYPSNSGGAGSGEGGIFSYFQSAPSPEEQARMTDEDNAMRVIKALDMIQIDRIFLDSVNLGSNAIIDMVDALCTVSRMELQISEGTTLGKSALDNKPRTFSLQKIVEVADSNMDTRPRFVWSRVWSILSEHFTFAGCHNDVRISMYAIDSLRQLTVKFLEKDELTGFSFQLQFMAPFEQMIARSSSVELRDLVLRCSENIILSRSKHIKSGWRVLLNVLTVGGHDPTSEVHSLAFSILNRLVKEHVDALDAHFPELVKCLHSFASNLSNNDGGLASKAIDLLEQAFHKVLSAPKATFSDERQSDRERVGRLWSLVRSFSMLMGDARLPVRHRAMDILFKELSDHATRISPAVWSILLRHVVLELFGDLRDSLQPFSARSVERIQRARLAFLHKAKDADADLLKILQPLLKPEVRPIYPKVLLEQGSQPLETTLGKILSQLTSLLSKFLDGSIIDDRNEKEELESPEWTESSKAMVQGLVLEDLLTLCERLALTDSKQVAQVGISILAKFLSQSGRYLGATQWDLITECIHNIMLESTPFYLIESKTRRWLKLDDETNNSNPKSNGEAKSPGSFSRKSVRSEDEIESRSGEPNTAESDVVDKRGVHFKFHEPRPGDLLPFNIGTTFTMCAVQLSLLEVLGRILPNNIGSMSEGNLLQMLDSIEESISFSNEFNDDLQLRQELQKRGFMADDASSNVPPSLLRQETLALGRYITLLFRSDGDAEKISLSADAVSSISMRLEKTLHTLFMHYLFQDRMRTAELEQMDNSLASRDISVRRQARGDSLTNSDAEVDMRYFTPVVAQSLHEVLHWDISKMKRQLPWLYPLLTALLDCGNREVHAALRQIFDQQISKLLGLDAKES